MPVHAARSEDEVVEAVQAARAWQAPLEIVAGGSKRELGRPVVANGLVLDVSGLNGIVSYQPEELILTARPGTPVNEIEAALSARGQRLGFEPPDWGPLLGAEAGVGTIGGAIAADANGSARVRCGAVRDQLLGIRAVNGFGEAFKAGGKVVKNVTGFDVPKLMCGAMGTLSVLTEVTLRVFPKPSRTAVLMARDLSPADGLALLRRVWASPLDATGLAFSKDRALIRLEGEAAPLAEKCVMLRKLLDDRALDDVPEGEIAFRALAGGEAFRDSPYDVWLAFVPPAAAAETAAAIDAPLWLADWAGGLLWLGTLPGSDGVRDAVRHAGGHAMLLRANEETRATLDVFEPQDAPRREINRRVKAAFDPLGLFNPGRMWDGA